MLIHWLLNLYILISWYFTVKQYCVFVGGGGFGHQRFGMYPFSQVVPAYVVDVALSPKTASDISNLKSTILIWWHLPGKMVDFLWRCGSLLERSGEYTRPIIFSEERVPWVPVQTIVDEAEIWRSTMCLVRSWKANNTNDEMLQLWCELRLSRQVWIISFLYALHPPSPYHAKSESSKLPKKGGVSPYLPVWFKKKHPKLKCQLIFQTLGTNKTKNPHQPHHVFFSLQQKKNTGPNVSKVVVSSFFHPWPELITQNGSHQQPLNFGHFQTSQVRFSTTGTPPVEVSLRNLVV